MATIELPQKELLDQLLKYDERSGKLFWLPRSPEMFEHGRRDADWRAANWNSKCAGKQAFAILSPNGYLAGKLGPRRFYAHRLIWRMVFDETPDDIDHIDGNRTNNRISNLRAVDRTANNRNSQYRRRSNSGHLGVYWNQAAKKWHASISVNNQQEHIGFFDHIDDAIAARKDRERYYGFSERHGYDDLSPNRVGDKGQP